MVKKRNLLKRLGYSSLATSGIGITLLGGAGAVGTKIADYARERGEEAGLVSRAIGTTFMGLISDRQKAGIIAYNNLSKNDIKELYAACGATAAFGGLIYLTGAIGRRKYSR